MKRSRISMAAAVAMTWCASAWAGGAPTGLLNKTVTVSFTASGTAKSASGATHGFSTQVSRIIYVSSNGRLFMRHTASNQKGMSRGGDFAPDDDRRGKGSFSFQGNQLVGVIPYANGARQISISFDGGFTSCTASVIEGRSNGTIRRIAPNGEMQEISSATTSSPGCSIASGNTFAN